MSRPKLWYDIEVYRHDFLLVFLDEQDEFTVLVNTLNGLQELIDNHELIGYNNYNYDDRMISMMLQYPASPELYASFNDGLIEKGIKYATQVEYSFDVMREILATPIGLKQIQSNMGQNIHETNVDFKMDRKLTEEEMKGAIEYCQNDVLETKKLFYRDERQNYYNSKKLIMEMYDLTPAQFKWNVPTITAHIFKNELTSTFGSKDLRTIINGLPNVPDDVKVFWINEEITDKHGKFKYKIDDNITYEFAGGGLHASNKRCVVNSSVYNMDYSSMYPHIIANNNMLGNKTKEYIKLLKDRLVYKQTDKLKAETYKLLLNKTYGAMGQPNSKLYNPYILRAVCYIGQDLLFGACKKLPQNKILNVNTDGIYATVPIEIPQRAGYPHETDEYTSFIQRDVNNYLACNGEDITVKGFLKNYKCDDPINPHVDNCITKQAAINYLLYRTPVNETIFNNLDKIELYQKTIKHGRTFSHVESDDGEVLENKINRGFATVTGKNYYKVKIVNGVKCRTVVDKELKASIHNGNLDDVDFKEYFKENIDADYYIDKSNEILKSLKGVV